MDGYKKVLRGKIKFDTMCLMRSKVRVASERFFSLRERDNLLRMVNQLLEKAQRLVDVAFDYLPRQTVDFKSREKVRVISHRGRGSWTLLGCAENTLPSFEKAIECGVWGIECDLRWTLDDVPIILHDSNTNFVFGRSLEVATKPFKELRESVPQVPRLEEVLDVLKGRAHLMLEIKEPIKGGQMGLLRECFRGWTPKEEFHLMSLSPKILNQIEGFPSEALVSIAELRTRAIISETLEKSWGGYTGHYLLTTNSMLGMCQKRGVLCGTGFVNSKNVLLREVSRGVHWIFTDNTDRIMGILSSKLE